MDRTVELAIKELSVEASRDEAVQVSCPPLLFSSPDPPPRTPLPPDQMLKIILLIIPIGVGLLGLATWSIVSAGGHPSLHSPLSSLLTPLPC
jgi:hypothetical protein